MNLWQRKLLAFLHDPPSKCAHLATHDQPIERAMQTGGFAKQESRVFANAILAAAIADSLC
ncbi:MAG: hypothetical protein HY735_03685 [Verrucomicrobia bacterium]|nr:hypothetical protein [Verrucomicrobiota bacterium]